MSHGPHIRVVQSFPQDIAAQSKVTSSPWPVRSAQYCDCRHIIPIYDSMDFFFTSKTFKFLNDPRNAIRHHQGLDIGTQLRLRRWHWADCLPRAFPLDNCSSVASHDPLDRSRRLWSERTSAKISNLLILLGNDNTPVGPPSSPSSHGPYTSSRLLQLFKYAMASRPTSNTNPGCRVAYLPITPTVYARSGLVLTDSQSNSPVIACLHLGLPPPDPPRGNQPSSKPKPLTLEPVESDHSHALPPTPQHKILAPHGCPSRSSGVRNHRTSPCSQLQGTRGKSTSNAFGLLPKHWSPSHPLPTQADHPRRQPIFPPPSCSVLHQHRLPTSCFPSSAANCRTNHHASISTKKAPCLGSGTSPLGCFGAHKAPCWHSTVLQVVSLAPPPTPLGVWQPEAHWKPAEELTRRQSSHRSLPLASFSVQHAGVWHELSAHLSRPRSDRTSSLWMQTSNLRHHLLDHPLKTPLDYRRQPPWLCTSRQALWWLQLIFPVHTQRLFDLWDLLFE